MRKNGLIRKIVYVIGTIILVISLLIGIFVFKNLSDYGRFKEEYNQKNNAENLPAATDAPGLSPEISELINSHSPVLKTAETDLSNVVLNLDDAHYNEFENYIRDIKVTYLYEDMFGIEEAFQKYKQLQFPVVSHSGDILDSNGHIDASELKRKILVNNEIYLKNDEDIGIKYYKEVEDKDLTQICEIIAETVEYHSQNNLINVDKVSCNLSTLKVFVNATPDMAYVTDDNCLVIIPDMIGVLQIMNPDQDSFRDTIIHETMHIFQHACIDMKNAYDYEKNYGNSYSWEELQINPLMWLWYIEASAEKNNTNYTGDKPSTYHNMIGYLESLSLSTILKDDVLVNQTERMTLNTGRLEPLFKQFECKNEQDQNEIIKMMYSIEIMQSDCPDFLSLYQKRYGEELAGQDKDVYNHTTKNSILTTLTKAFYLNLAKQVSEENIPLHDVFFLITVFENDINSHVMYNNMERFEYIKDFLKVYIDIQDTFFKALSQSSNYDIEKVLDAYSDYGLTILKDGEKAPNYRLDWLAQDKREYILSRDEFLRDMCTGNIRNSFSIMLEAQNS